MSPWRNLARALGTPRQEPLPCGPVHARPTRGEQAAKRREEMEARLSELPQIPQSSARQTGTNLKTALRRGGRAPWLVARRPSILFLSEITSGSG